MGFFADCAGQVAVDPEVRFDKPYDEQLPGTVVHPGGSLIASGDRGFQGASCRAVLDLWDEARRPW